MKHLCQWRYTQWYG